MTSTRTADQRALMVVRTAYDTYRRYGYGAQDPNRITARWAAYIASGRWPHSAADARDGFCYCDWCAADRDRALAPTG